MGVHHIADLAGAATPLSARRIAGLSSTHPIFQSVPSLCLCLWMIMALSMTRRCLLAGSHMISSVMAKIPCDPVMTGALRTRAVLRLILEITRLARFGPPWFPAEQKMRQQQRRRSLLLCLPELRLLQPLLRLLGQRALNERRATWAQNRGTSSLTTMVR